MPMSLFSEPYSATGNIGENFRKLLGTPSTDALQTAIREALQNIADAALPGRGPEILIRVRRLTAAENIKLREEVFRELPAEEESGRCLRKALEDESHLVLEICDFNTVGLGGPVRADMVPDANSRTDFIDFMMNVGSPRDVPGGGGTYGFGKAALYRLSRCTAILVDTLPSDGPRSQRRLMACHVGHSFYAHINGKRRRFTGRHWWGRLLQDPSPRVEPLVGDGAARLAEALGFPPRPPGRTGTSIMILGFDPPAVCNGAGEETEDEQEPESLSTIGGRIIEAVLWNFWPRMMDSTPPERKFKVSVEVDGKSLRIPRPEGFPPLDLFCRAMNKLRSGSGGGTEIVRCERPIRELGRLAIEKGLRVQRKPLVRRNSLFPDKAHHIALMRPVELVVKYLEGTPLPDESVEWAGVFRVSDDHDVERAFAESEPPAHDDWNPANLPKGQHKTFVNVALRKLKQCALEQGRPGPPKPNGDGPAIPLGEAADMLGKILERTTGGGPSVIHVTPPGPGTRGKKKESWVSVPKFRRLEEHKGRAVAVFEVDFEIQPKDGGQLLKVQPAVMLDGQPQAPDPALLTQTPQVLGFRINGQVTPLREGEGLGLEGISSPVEVLVAIPPDCAVSLKAWLDRGEVHE